MMNDIKQRFFEKVHIAGEDDCWLWNAGTTKDGYGIFGVSTGIVKTAHRFSKEIELGTPIPRNLDASHLCDNRSCVNPRHIVIETRSENMARRKLPLRHLRCPSKHRKLTREDADYIRASSLKLRELAAAFAVGMTAIFRIKHDVTYISVSP